MTQLAAYRSEIDQIDENIINLLYQRFDIVKKVGEYKKENNVLVVQEDRWKSLLETIRALGEKEGLNPDMIEDIRNRIHQESIELQKKVNLT